MKPSSKPNPLVPLPRSTTAFESHYQNRQQQQQAANGVGSSSSFGGYTTASGSHSPNAPPARPFPQNPTSGSPLTGAAATAANTSRSPGERGGGRRDLHSPRSVTVVSPQASTSGRETPSSSDHFMQPVYTTANTTSSSVPANGSHSQLPNASSSSYSHTVLSRDGPSYVGSGPSPTIGPTSDPRSSPLVSSSPSQGGLRSPLSPTRNGAPDGNNSPTGTPTNANHLKEPKYGTKSDGKKRNAPKSSAAVAVASKTHTPSSGDGNADSTRPMAPGPHETIKNREYGRAMSLSHNPWADVLLRFGDMDAPRALAIACLFMELRVPKPAPDATSYLTHDLMKEIGIVAIGDRCQILQAVARMPHNYTCGDRVIEIDELIQESKDAVLHISTMATDPARVGLSRHAGARVEYFDLHGKDSQVMTGRSEYERALRRLVAELEPECKSLPESALFSALRTNLPMPHLMIDADFPARAVLVLRVCSLPVEADDDSIEALTNRWTIFLDVEAGIIATIHRLDTPELAELRDAFPRFEGQADTKALLLAVIHRFLGAYAAGYADISVSLDRIEGQMLDKSQHHVELLTHLFHLQRRGSVYDRMLRLAAETIFRDLLPFSSIADVDGKLRGKFDKLQGDIQGTLSRARELLDIHLSLVSYRTNNVMTTLTKFTMVFAPLSFLCGLYGMNFTNMPELQTENGYFVLLGVMAAVAILVMLFFSCKGF